MPTTASASLDAGAPPAAAARYRNMNPALAARRYAAFRAGQLPGQRGGVAAQPPPPPGDLQGTEAPGAVPNMEAGPMPLPTGAVGEPPGAWIAPDSYFKPFRGPGGPGAPGMGDYLQGPPPALMERLRQLGIGGPPSAAGPAGAQPFQPADDMPFANDPRFQEMTRQAQERINAARGGVSELPATTDQPIAQPVRDFRKPLRVPPAGVNSDAFAPARRPGTGGALQGGQGGRLQRQLRRVAAY